MLEDIITFACGNWKSQGRLTWSSWYSVMLAIKECSVMSTGIPYSCQVYFSCSASNIYHHEGSSVYLWRMQFIFVRSFSQVLQATLLNTLVTWMLQIKFNNWYSNVYKPTRCTKFLFVHIHIVMWCTVHTASNWYSLFSCSIIGEECFQSFEEFKICLWCFYIVWGFSAGRHTIALKQAIVNCCKSS